MFNNNSSLGSSLTAAQNPFQTNANMNSDMFSRSNTNDLSMINTGAYNQPQLGHNPSFGQPSTPMGFGTMSSSDTVLNNMARKI